MIEFELLGATTHITSSGKGLSLIQASVNMVDLCFFRREKMARGSKEKYTAEQKKKAAHIEESYEAKGAPKKKAEAIAWATVNKQSGGGEKKDGSGQKKSAAEKKEARESSAQRAAASKRGQQPVGNMPT